jgi:hypothetical protein
MVLGKQLYVACHKFIGRHYPLDVHNETTTKIQKNNVLMEFIGILALYKVCPFYWAESSMIHSHFHCVPRHRNPTQGPGDFYMFVQV